MDVSTISADHGTAIEPIFADQIEVFRGPATLLYGSGASGGLVNISNGRILNYVPTPMQGAIYNHYYTVSDGWIGAFKLDSALNPNLAVHVDGLRRSTENVDIPGFARVAQRPRDPRGILPNSATETENLSAGASFIVQRSFLGFNISTYTNHYGVLGEEETNSDNDINGVTIDQEQVRYDVDGAVDVDALFIDSVKTRWGYGNYEHDEIEPSGEVGTRFGNEEVEGRFEILHRRFGAWKGVAGLQYRHRVFAAVSEEAFVPASELDTIALFLFEKADFSRVRIDVGLRYENQHTDVRDNDMSAEHNLFSASGGGAFEYTSDHFVGFSGTRSQRGPTIEELFADGPHLSTNSFEIGDPALDGETSMNVDLYLRKTCGRYRYDFTLFYNGIEDFIFLRPNDANEDGLADRVDSDFRDTVMRSTNPDALLLINQAQRDAVFWGFELEAEMTAFEDSRGRLDVRLWTDFVDGELDGGDTVPRLPPLRFGENLSWEHGSAYAALAVTRVTSERNPALLDTETNGFTMVNIDVGYTIKIDDLWALAMFARGSNLANATARKHVSFVKDLAPLPGASALFGFRARF